MPAEIGLLESRVIMDVVQEFEGPDNLLGRGILGTPDSDPNSTWEYDIIRQSRGAQLVHNTPNSEAQILDQLIIGHAEGGYAYMRDKKVFNATTLRWLRRAGNSAVAAGQAEAKVLEELEDIRMQHMRAEEVAIWSMFQGSWAYTMVGGTTVTVNYQLPAAHSPTVSTSWGASSDDPIGDIRAWKQLMVRDSGFPISVAYLNATTMTVFLKLAEVAAELSDRQKDTYTAEGRVPRFFGIDWIEYDGGYLNSSGTYVPYIPNDHIIFLAPGGTPAWRMLYGPSGDVSAPDMWTGPYTKSWVEEDPSGRQVLMENHYMPILRKPFQVIDADITA